MAHPKRTVRLSASPLALRAAIVAVGAGMSLIAFFRWVQYLKAKAERHARFLALAQPHAPRQLHTTAKDPECVVVLGAGISGLVLAWHLKRLSPATRVVVVEADGAIGGNIQTAALGDGSFIELGPRSLRTTTHSATVALQVSQYNTVRNR